MITYQVLVEHFGLSLSDAAFQSFLRSEFDDITKIEVNEVDYIISQSARIELGFKTSDEIFNEGVSLSSNSGNFVFTHFNIFPSENLFELPFGVRFSDLRNDVLAKAGIPTQTKQGEASLYGPGFLVDNYKVGDRIITFDYDPKAESLNFIQLRDNNLCTSNRL